MIASMSRVWLLIVGAIALGACDPSPEAQAQLLCTTLFECLATPLPGTQRDCVQECLSDDDITNVPQVCAECVFTHADRCASLLNDCNSVCGGPEPGGGPVPDAGVRGGI